MEKIIIERKEDSPRVVLDADNGLIEIEGECYPENAFEFFEPIVAWIEEYFKNNNQETQVKFKLSYFNSSTTQILFDIFDILEEAKGDNLKIIWQYDPENMNTYKDYEEFNEEFEELHIEAVAG